MREFIVVFILMFLSTTAGVLVQKQITAADKKVKPECTKASYLIHMKKGHIEMYNQRERLIWSGMFDENCPSLEEAILKDNL